MLCPKVFSQDVPTEGRPPGPRTGYPSVSSFFVVADVRGIQPPCHRTLALAPNGGSRTMAIRALGMRGKLDQSTHCLDTE